MSIKLLHKTWITTGKLLFWLSWPLSYAAIAPSHRTRVLIIVGEEIVLVKVWLGSGGWGLPGGGLHKHELPLIGAIREVSEEVGITLKPPQLIPLGMYAYRHVGLPFRCHLFAAHLQARPRLQRQAIEISAVSWLDGRQLNNQNAQPDVLEALRRLADQG